MVGNPTSLENSTFIGCCLVTASEMSPENCEKKRLKRMTKNKHTVGMSEYRQNRQNKKKRAHNDERGAHERILFDTQKVLSSRETHFQKCW